MPTSQDRHDLSAPILEHEARLAGSLVDLKIRSVTASATFSTDRGGAGADDTVLADATTAPVVMTLPAGSDALIGHRFAAVKTDASGNAVSIARAGSNTIEGGTSISTTTQHGRLEVYWDGSMWRRAAAAAGGGAISAASLSLSGNLSVAGTSALVGAVTMGSGGSAAVFTPGASVLDLAKSFQVTGQIFSTQLVSAPLVVETKAAEAKAADTPFAIAANDRMLSISTTGAGSSAITAGDTLEVGQEVFIRMSAASGGGDYTMAIGTKTVTFAAADDTCQIKHYGSGVWAIVGGTAVVS